MECNVVIQLFANTILKGTPESVRERIERLLETSSTFKIKEIEFVSEGGEITGIFNEEWNEIS